MYGAGSGDFSDAGWSGGGFDFGDPTSGGANRDSDSVPALHQALADIAAQDDVAYGQQLHDSITKNDINELYAMQNYKGPGVDEPIRNININKYIEGITNPSGMEGVRKAMSEYNALNPNMDEVLFGQQIVPSNVPISAVDIASYATGFPYSALTRAAMGVLGFFGGRHAGVDGLKAGYDDGTGGKGGQGNNLASQAKIMWPQDQMAGNTNSETGETENSTLWEALMPKLQVRGKTLADLIAETGGGQWT